MQNSTQKCGEVHYVNSTWNVIEEKNIYNHLSKNIDLQSDLFFFILNSLIMITPITSHKDCQFTKIAWFINFEKHFIGIEITLSMRLFIPR